MIILPPGIIGGARRLAPTIEFIGTDLDTGSGAGQSFTGVPFGDEVKNPNKRWIVCVFQTTTSVSLSGTPTIGGVPATVTTLDTPEFSSLQYRYNWFVAQPAGTSGNIAYTISVSANTRIFVFRVVNLNCGAMTDSDDDHAKNAAALSIDTAPVSRGYSGGVLGVGHYAYADGDTPTSAPFANLSTLHFLDASNGYTAAGAVFAAQQSGLDVSFDPSPNTNLTRSHASVVSFPHIF